MTHAKTIVLVGPTYPYRGGIAHFQQHLAGALERRGYRVTEVTFRRQYPEFLFPGKQQYVESVDPARIRARRLIDTVQPLTYRQTAREIRALKPDAVIFQYWMPFLAPALGTVARSLRRRGIPTYAVVHNVLPHEALPGARLLARFFLRSLRGAITLSRVETEQVQALLPGLPVKEAFHPLYEHFGPPLPRAEARHRLGLPADAPVLLFFGLVRPYKGLWTLLHALPRIREALPDARLVVAGEWYEAPAPYLEWLESRGLMPAVHLENRYIPDAEVATFFSAADVVVQPYRSATQSGVVQTAYHFERPVIVTDVGGLAERVIHGHSGLVVPPDNPEALAAAVIQFFREGRQPRLEAGVRQEKSKYTWEAFVDLLSDWL